MSEPVKWTLQVTPKKGGGATYRVTNGKAGFNVSQSAICFRPEDATNGCEVVVETAKNGQPVKVTIPGKPETQGRATAPPASQGSARHRGSQPASGGGQGRSGTRPGAFAPTRRMDPPARRDATAPYNFVSAESPLAFPDDPSEIRFSGSIECSGEALTPLLVAEPQNTETARRDGTVPARHFFTVAGKPVIPGTSLKGMIRGVVEALSRAPMQGLVSTTTIGTRDLSTPESAYSQRFKDAIADNRLRAGFLEQHGAEHTITPCEFAAVRLSDLGLPVQKNAYATQVAAKARSISERLRVRFSIGSSSDPSRPPLAENPQFVNSNTPPTGMIEGQFVPTGGIPIRGGEAKNKGYVFYALTSTPERLLLDDETVTAFEDQRTEPQKELLAFYRKHDLPIPVFYLIENGEVAAFGLCRFFRIKTTHSPADLASSLPPGVTDRPMSELLFGSVGLMPRRGRVRCSIGTFAKQPKSTRFPSDGNLVAGNPAASAISMYLVQDSPNAFCRDGRNRALITYDDKPTLRGRKFYWHRRQPAAPLPPNDNLNVQAVYHPLAAGVVFTFTVSFERLSLAQVGALCEAIELPAGHAHKLGLGKPFGLGSVRLTVDWNRTRISADRDRYAFLIRRLRDLAAPEPNTRENSPLDIAKHARTAFHDMVTAADHRPGAPFEDLPHVQQFRALTHWERPPEPTVVRYMPLNLPDRGMPSYQLKPILEDPRGVDRPATGG